VVLDVNHCSVREAQISNGALRVKAVQQGPDQLERRLIEVPV
jgi:hypothetical protein